MVGGLEERERANEKVYYQRKESFTIKISVVREANFLVGERNKRQIAEKKSLSDIAKFQKISLKKLYVQ